MTLEVFTWSCQQAEDVSDQSCYRKRLPNYLKNVQSSLETLGEILLFRGFTFAPNLLLFFFRVLKRNLVGLFYYNTNKRTCGLLSFFFFTRQSGSKLAQTPPKTKNAPQKSWKKKQQKKKTSTFVGIVMNNSAKFGFPTLKNQGAKVWKKYGSPIAGTS